VVIVETIGVITVEEGELRFVLLDLDERFLELGTILSNMRCCFLHHFLDLAGRDYYAYHSLID
jgi:hypothetical protein